MLVVLQHLEILYFTGSLKQTMTASYWKLHGCYNPESFFSTDSLNTLVSHLLHRSLRKYHQHYRPNRNLTNGNNNEDDGSRNVKSFQQTTINQDTDEAPDKLHGVTSFSVGSAQELTAAQ